MARPKITFESDEQVPGSHPGGRDWVRHVAVLKVRDSGKKPVSLEMKIVPPSPLACEMPEKHEIRVRTITEAYAKVAKFFAKFGMKFRD